MPFVLSRLLHLVLRPNRRSFVLVCSQAHALRPCRHPSCPLLCQRPHLAETRQRDKLRTVSCLSGSSSVLPAWACVGRRSHRTPGVLDVLSLPGCGCLRWSRPFEMVICLVGHGKRISEGISCGSSVFRFAFNRRLAALGCTFRFGPRDCRRFLRQMNLKWRKPAGERRKWSRLDRGGRGRSR